MRSTPPPMAVTWLTPTLGPVTSVMGEILLIGLSSEDGVVEGPALRTLADWTVRPRLLSIPGVSPSGKARRAASRRSVTCWRPRHRSSPHPSSTHTTLRPAADWLRTRSTPGAPATACSIGVVTHSSTSSGERAPAEALFEAEGRSFLFVKTAPEAFVLREVHVGSRGAETVEVHEGLRPGERVVTVAVGSLRGVAGR